MTYITDTNNKMSIVNFFNDSTKRNLSDNFKSDGAEDPKKMTEECSGSCEADDGDVLKLMLNDVD